MFKRNPDAIALVLIVCFMVGSAAAPWRRMQRTTRITRIAERQEMKVRLRHSVASLKQCFRPIVIRHKPIQRSL